MEPNISQDDLEILLPEHKIQNRVQEMGHAIEERYQSREPIVFVGVLKGAFLFMSDLVRQVHLPLTCDFLRVSSYGDSTESSGVVRFEFDLTSAIEGKHVVIVEDIIDTGNTIDYLLDNLRTRSPESLSVCSLLRKPDRLEKEVQIDFKGFDVPNRFVVGYGLDYAEKFRNLPYIAAIPGAS